MKPMLPSVRMSPQETAGGWTGATSYVCHIYGRQSGAPPSKDACVPIPASCDSVALHGQWDFLSVIKGLDLEMGRLPWITQVDSMES